MCVTAKHLAQGWRGSWGNLNAAEPQRWLWQPGRMGQGPQAVTSGVFVGFNEC